MQEVGDYNWLKENYDFTNLSYYIDELLVIDVSRKKRNSQRFCSMLKKLSSDCFLPIGAGGGLDSLDKAKMLFDSGADKLILNTSVYENPELIKALNKFYGQQAIIASVDIKKNELGIFDIYTHNGTKKASSLKDYQNIICKNEWIGELYLNSMERDGTGQGYDFNMLKSFTNLNKKHPIILAGGAGKTSHIVEGLLTDGVDACATAHLFNFIGDKLAKTRCIAKANGISLGEWLPKASLS
ncbi:HisA/HisF-related TIM barrel protein [Prochlorococcus marinus]|uniref:HisA/HisF-related TIM barrel protein n=1 Tax=Prochlorococcus marinus TaxID=1219 RepID=UPI001F3081B1|nr:HisA/HisF-related TIM barrel protein [Prochlorococcus marinus]